ncbi:hypothetical protein K3495_g2244 [Podosphaera aphanis]|nr:hypothetical protein K3495_g2244 [Podosphaera aphanis]
MAQLLRRPQKRILGEPEKKRKECPSTLVATKKRKLEPYSPESSPSSAQNVFKKKSSQIQPSQFETEVLEKMSQDIAGLKKTNSEKDQEWSRPGLGDFNPSTNNLCFQQIECEEGSLSFNTPTVKLFGVTEASFIILLTTKLF